MTDVVVVGAGVFGLACAWSCVRRGLRVIVLEAETPGAGASGGVVGALSPHAPGGWSARKRFQFEALAAAAAGWAEIATAGGIEPGYARPGRLIPLPTAAARARAEAQAVAARRTWGDVAAWRVEDAAPDRVGRDWVAPDAAAHGVVVETLSARVDPRRAVAALAAAVAAGGGEIRCGWRVAAVEDGGVRGARGRMAAGAVILAGGAAGFALTPELPGRAVKGQAATLALDTAPGTPLVYAGGVYVAPQPGGRVAVGATSEDAWVDATATDAALDAVIARARALCPALRGAKVVERWAGLRPRAARPDPMLGPVPGRAGVFVATGGFRIGFGIALAVGETMAGLVTGAAAALPEGFAAADHLGARQPRR